MKQFQMGAWSIAVTTQRDGLDTIVFAKQAHGGVIVNAEECISGQTEADGISLAVPNLVIGINTADCLPLVLLTNKAALALHVSRKTLINGLLDAVCDVLPIQEVNHIFIGPHICPTHLIFDHAGEEIQTFMRKFPGAWTQSDTIHLSLRKAVQQYIDEWGLSNVKITQDDRCTFEDSSLISYRRSLQDKHPTSITLGISTIVSSA